MLLHRLMALCPFRSGDGGRCWWFLVGTITAVGLALPGLLDLAGLDFGLTAVAVGPEFDSVVSQALHDLAWCDHLLILALALAGLAATMALFRLAGSGAPRGAAACVLAAAAIQALHPLIDDAHVRNAGSLAGVEAALGLATVSLLALASFLAARRPTDPRARWWPVITGAVCLLVLELGDALAAGYWAPGLGFPGLCLRLSPMLAAAGFLLALRRRARAAEPVLGRATLLATVPFALGAVHQATAPFQETAHAFFAAHFLVTAAFALTAAGAAFDLLHTLEVTRHERERRLLSGVLDALPLQIVVTDEKERCVLSNRPISGAANLSRALPWAAGVAESGETLLATTDGRGQVRTLRVSAHRVATPVDGLALHMISAMDVTDLKQSQERVEERLRFTRALMDAIPLPVFCKDPRGFFSDCNRAFESFFGCTREEIVGLSVGQAFPAAVAAFLQKTEMALLESGGRRQCEIRLPRADGCPRTIRSYETAFTDPHGRVAGLVGTFYDLTDQLEAEEALRRSEQSLRSILEQAHDAFVSIDTAGTVRNWNRQAERLFGWRRDEAEGRPLAETLRPEIDFADPDALARARDACSGTGGPGLTLETVVHARDGRAVPVVVTVWRTEAGGAAIYNAFLRDLTDTLRERREREQIELQLRQAQKLEAIGQLASGIAHEINTPTQFVGDNVRFLGDACGDLLQALRAHGELLAAATREPATAAAAAAVAQQLARLDLDYLTKEVPSAIQQSLEGIERVTAIVRAMKEFAHPGNPGCIAPADLNRAIRNTAAISRNEWKYVANLELDLAPDLPPVPCLAGEINQVLLNLIINAAHAIAEKFGGDGACKGTIRVSTRHAGGWVEIEVADNGSGVPAAIRDRIFEPFFTTKPVGKGSGQGLAIARAVVVNKHRGSLSFESREGEGTTFVARLPLADAATATVREPEHETHSVC